MTAERLWVQAPAKLLLLLLHVHLVWEEGTGGDMWPHTFSQHCLWQRTDVLRARWEVEERLRRNLELRPRSAGSEAVCCSLQEESSNALPYPLGWRGGSKTQDGAEQQELQRIAWDWQDHKTIKLCCLVISELPAGYLLSMWMCTLNWRHTAVQACVPLAEGERVLCSRQGSEARLPHLASPS